MKRLTPLLALSCLAVGPCGGGGGDDDFRADGSSALAATNDTGADDTGTGTDDTEQTEDGGNKDPAGFVTWSLACYGDNQEYTWTASAETNFGASVVTVTLDPGTAGWDTITLDMQDGEGRVWEGQISELLMDRGCNTTAVLEWYALANGGGDATEEGAFP